MKSNKIQNKKVNVYKVSELRLYPIHSQWNYGNYKYFLKVEDAIRYFIEHYNDVKNYNDAMISQRNFRNLAPNPSIQGFECKFKDLKKYFGNEIDDALALAVAQTFEKLEPVEKETAEDQAFEKEFDGNN